MNYVTHFKRTLAVTAAAVLLAAASLAGPASAAVQYDPNGTSTSKTPVFNHIFGVPNGVGNEADFVRVKPKAGTNADYANNINAACGANEVYTVRTYIHNGADPTYNTAEGGIAIARNVVVAMTAPLNTPNSQFEFKSTISASNAASVTDNAFLTCANGKQVKLSLVPSSVQTYAKPIGFQSAPDSSVNGTLKIGSRTQGSGDVFACWDDRVIVTYDVKIVEIPTTPPPVTPPPTTPPPTTPPPATPPAPTPPPATPAGTPPPATTVLPAAGPAGVALVALLVTGASTFGYYWIAGRKLM